MDPVDAWIGDHLGAYRITGAMPNGGYAAVHRHDGQRVCLLVAPAGHARTLFEHTRTLAALPHPGIARIVDRGVLADHRPWLALEVPRGLPLFELIARRPMPPAEAASLLHDLADVLSFAHERGVVHRALAMRSIVVTTGQRAFPVCITDFGFGEAPPLGYEAPEGAAGDGRVDVFALGVIAYRAVTQLFPTSVVDDVPGATPALAELVARMLARDPAERPTAAEVRGTAAQLAGIEDVPAPAGDRAHVAPRFSSPRWTPSPDGRTRELRPITSDGSTAVAGEIVDRTSKV
jgi:serine/threonine-protein kinase